MDADRFTTHLLEGQWFAIGRGPRFALAGATEQEAVSKARRALAFYDSESVQKKLALIKAKFPAIS
jgi:hypothetical protein